MSPEEIAGRSFAVVRRGFEPDAVRRFLEEVAGIVRQARARETDLHARLADAEQRAASPVLDDAVLSAALGAETARVLQVAHEAAQEVVAKAEQRAEALLEEASTVHATRAAAAEAEVARVLDEARRTAEDIVERTKAECRSMLEQARDARRRMLDDLAARRRDLHGQIEQLRAAKDALSGIFADAAGAVADVQARLQASEEEAQAAAGEVARRLHGEAGEGAMAVSDASEADGALPAAGEPAPSAVLADFGSEFEGYDEAADQAALEAELAAILPVAGVPVFDAEREAEEPGHAGGAEAAGEAEVERSGAAAVEEDEPVEAAADEDGARSASQAEAAGEELATSEAAPVVPDDLPAPAPAPAAAEPAGTVETEGTERASEEPGGDLAVGDEGTGRSGGSSVEALFARIRASRAEEVARAREVLAEPEAAATGAAEAPATVPAAPVGETEEGEEQAPGAEVAEWAEEGEEQSPGAEEAEGVAAGEEQPPGAEEAEGVAAAARRDEALGPVRIEVARALKRVLRSQQNELLDAARTLKVADAEELLASDQTAERITEAVEPAIVAAWRAGRAQVGDPGAAKADGKAASQLATGLAEEVVGAIEGRIREGIASLEASGSAGEDALGELVGVAYRDWKGARIDAVAAEVALRAFAAGSVAGAGAIGAKVRWVLESTQPCPDCDDNALSEPLVPGEAFPTGQAHPPLHAGCRCVLVAVPG